MSEWRAYKIEDIATLSNGINFGKTAYSKGIKLIGVSDFKDRMYPDYDSLQEVNAKVVRTSDYLKYGDIVFVRSNGNKELVGRCMMVNKDTPVTYSGFCIKLRLNDTTAFNPVFLTYLCKTQQFRKSMAGTAVGANIQNLSQSRLGGCIVNIPDISTQRHIATILSRYDSLIENYQKQIKLLEEVAQRLYKEWFIDLHFPGHENTNITDGVPEGWVKKKVGEMLIMHIGGGWGKDCPDGAYDVGGYVIRGTDISQIEIGNMNIPYRYHTESNLKERRLKEGDIIFEVSGGSAKEPVGRTLFVTEELVSYFGQNTICASFCKKMSFKSIQESIISYHTIRYFRKIGYLHKYEKDSAGKIINYNWNDFLNEFEILIPESKMLDNISKRFNNIIAETSKKKSQLRLLTEARDRLLPKLMSGEIEV